VVQVVVVLGMEPQIAVALQHLQVMVTRPLLVLLAGDQHLIIQAVVAAAEHRVRVVQARIAQAVLVALDIPRIYLGVLLYMAAAVVVEFTTQQFLRNRVAHPA
jgi:hypothetical protein